MPDPILVTGSETLIDFSLLGLFMRADLIVKGVIFVLCFASFWSWAVIFNKVFILQRIIRKSDTFEESFWSGEPLDDLFHRIGHRPGDPLSIIFCAGMQEWRRSLAKKPNFSQGNSLKAGIQQRVERVMQITVSRQLEELEHGMNYLASVGSVAPFVGLFGTVWGIMNSFKQIAAEKSTSLIVVAPAIAEALFATALGLVAAIPATMAYNKLSTDLMRFGNRLDSFASEFGTIISHQLEETHSS